MKRKIKAMRQSWTAKWSPEQLEPKTPTKSIPSGLLLIAHSYSDYLIATVNYYSSGTPFGDGLMERTRGWAWEKRRGRHKTTCIIY